MENKNRLIYGNWIYDSISITNTLQQHVKSDKKIDSITRSELKKGFPIVFCMLLASTDRSFTNFLSNLWSEVPFLYTIYVDLLNILLIHKNKNNSFYITNPTVLTVAAVNAAGKTWTVLYIYGIYKK